MKTLAVISTHPIQYYAPVFRLLAQRVNLKVFYTWGNASLDKLDPGFGKRIEWDIPLLEGYNYEFLTNIAKDPGSHHKMGIINPDIIDRITSFEPSAILVYGYAYDSHLKVMRHFKGKTPIWFRGDSTLLDRQSFLKKLAKEIYLKYVYKNVDRALYVGTANKTYFKQYGLKENQLVFSPHAIDNQRFSEDHRSESYNLRLRLGISENDILILFAGKLEEKKDPILLLEAFIKLNSEAPKRKYKVHLLFVGNGELENDIKSKVKSPKLNEAISNQIHFLDFQNQRQMPIIYQACNLFCLPSKGPGETWGLAVNEAMAASKAILVSDKVGCGKDLILENRNGLKFRSGNLADLTQKLSFLSDDIDRLKEMGNKSRKIISEWNFEKQVDIIIGQLAII